MASLLYSFAEADLAGTGADDAGDALQSKPHRRQCMTSQRQLSSSERLRRSLTSSRRRIGVNRSKQSSVPCEVAYDLIEADEVTELSLRGEASPTHQTKAPPPVRKPSQPSSPPPSPPLKASSPSSPTQRQRSTLGKKISGLGRKGFNLFNRNNRPQQDYETFATLDELSLTQKSLASRLSLAQKSLISRKSG